MNFVKHLIRFALHAAGTYPIESLKGMLKHVVPRMVGVGAVCSVSVFRVLLVFLIYLSRASLPLLFGWIPLRFLCLHNMVNHGQLDLDST